MSPIFITGIGTGIGKSLISAIVVRALNADYWKPVQAGTVELTDTEWIKAISGGSCRIHAEAYRLDMPASPHISSRAQGISIDLGSIKTQYDKIVEMDLQRTADDRLKETKHPSGDGVIVVEGAGGLMVPLNEQEFVLDLIKCLKAKVILVSRNYLGSINHSLLTTLACRKYDLHVLGWIFNDQYQNYEQDIANWSGFPIIGSIPYCANIDQAFILQQAGKISVMLNRLLLEGHEA